MVVVSTSTPKTDRFILHGGSKGSFTNALDFDGNPGGGGIPFDLVSAASSDVLTSIVGVLTPSLVAVPGEGFFLLNFLTSVGIF